MEEESSAKLMTSTETTPKPIFLSSKLPRLAIQLKNLIKILSEESAIKIFREISKKAHITDLYNAASHLQGELGTFINEQNMFSQQFSQISSELLIAISSFKKELDESKKTAKINFYTKNLNSTIDQFAKAITNQLKKSKTQNSQNNENIDVQKVIAELDSLFINFQSKTEIKFKKGKDSITVDMVNQMIDSFQQFENYQKSIWKKIFLKDKNWTESDSADINLPWNEQQIRFKGFLETTFHQLLFIAEFKERLAELENHLNSLIKHKNKIIDNDFNQKKQISKSIFSKKNPFDYQNNNIVGKITEVPTSAATPSEAQMMEERINAFSKVIEQTKFCPKPYDRIAELKNENKRLNEVFNDGWVTSQQYSQLKEKNEELKQSINDLNAKISLIKKQLSQLKKKRKNKK